jgi:hypothetical protein
MVIIARSSQLIEPLIFIFELKGSPLFKLQKISFSRQKDETISSYAYSQERCAHCKPIAAGVSVTEAGVPMSILKNLSDLFCNAPSRFKVSSRAPLTAIVTIAI